MAMLNRRTLLGSLSSLLAMSSRTLAAVLGYPRLIEGPMLGPASANSFTVWSRASGVFDIEVEYADNKAFNHSQRTPPMRARADNDLITVIPVTGLKAGTDYYYRMRIDGIADRHQPLAFHTRTMVAELAPLRVAFGSCARVQFDPVQPIFAAIHAMEPDLFVWLGDNIYGDSDQASVFTDLYQRQRAVPSLQPLLTSTPQIAIWDDHDFGYNDADGSNPFKDTALSLFRRYWPNPTFGLPDAPGVFFKHALPGVDFFMLDGRYYRDPSDAADGPSKTMLGKRQLQWLRDELKASRAVFKVLVSGTGWSSAEANGDSWARYLHERNALFDFIRDQNITGVFGLSGDVHMGELNCVPWSERGGYDFYDLTSSGLAQLLNQRFPEQRPEVRLRHPFVASTNFGLLYFNFEGTPSVTMGVRNVIGGEAWQPITLTIDELKNGVRSWAKKIDKTEMERRQRMLAGGSYC